MFIRTNRFQKRKRPKRGFLGCLLVFLASAAVILSILMLMLSWVAIERYNSLADPRGGISALSPHLEGWPKAPQLRNRVIDVNNNDGAEAKSPESEQRKLILAAAKYDSGARISEVAPQLSNRVIAVNNNDGPEAKPSESEQRKPLSNTAESESVAKISEDYQPAQKGKRLLTYQRFGGRLNNQLIQFVTALQHAKVLKRTLIVPDECEDIHWTGMFDGFGIWDLESLNNAYDIDWTTGLSSEFRASVPKNCVLSLRESRHLLVGGPKLWEEWDKKCPDVIDLDGHDGLFFCQQQHQFCGNHNSQMEAYKIYDHIKLAPSLVQHIPSKRKEFKDQGYDELAIHSRRAGEGGYDWEFCVDGNRKTCKSHIVNTNQYKVCDFRTQAGNCAIWLDFEYQIKSRSALKKDLKQYKFVLASDGTHDWNIDFEGQFIVSNNTDWLHALEQKVHDAEDPKKLINTMAVGSVARSVLRNQKDLSKMRGKLDGLTATLLDLFSLVDSTYLLGAYYSTLSLNACLFRGLNRIYDSNMCWMLMHPTTKHGVLPSPEESVNVNENPEEDDPLPVGLMTDVEHAFVRSNDGNFIAIDRYAIQWPGKHVVVGVLGDGIVPMTISKNKKGEETIQANITCSFGNELNSPATIVLMKGNQLYSEHYYARGKDHRTPFSSNGDRFRTMLILCEKLRYDGDLSRQPPLILRSQDGIFSLTIGSTFQRPINGGQTGSTLVHCLSPTYGLKDPRWIIEYLEYHRALGVSHVHLYNVDMHSPEIQSSLQVFRDEKFITRHDWSHEASGGYTSRGSYEHAKWAAQTDCALRSRGIYDYALFSDIDEIAVGQDSGLKTAIEMCDEAKKKSGKIACSFNSNTVSSIYTELNEEEEMAMEDKLILERYTGVEAKPLCPFNCKCMQNDCSIMTRKFHYGRQKYIANVRDLTIPPRPMWTHALSRDYDEMDQIMEVLPNDVMHVRYYHGLWYKNEDLLDTVAEEEAPLPASLMDIVRSSISNSNRRKYAKYNKRLIYSKARNVTKSNTVEWIKTVERPPRYHTKKTS